MVPALGLVPEKCFGKGSGVISVITHYLSLASARLRAQHLLAKCFKERLDSFYLLFSGLDHNPLEMTVDPYFPVHLHEYSAILRVDRGAVYDYSYVFDGKIIHYLCIPLLILASFSTGYAYN